LPQLIPVRAKVQGLLIADFATRFGEASERLGQWVASGDLKHRETVVEGLENAPDAFLGLFSGDNIGKQVVRVSAADAA
ncbi:NADP-dependent oxidoreductase, partial [Halorubrum ezzemoulense]